MRMNDVSVIEGKRRMAQPVCTSLSNCIPYPSLYPVFIAFVNQPSNLSGLVHHHYLHQSGKKLSIKNSTLLLLSHQAHRGAYSASRVEDRIRLLTRPRDRPCQGRWNSRCGSRGRLPRGTSRPICWRAILAVIDSSSGA